MASGMLGKAALVAKATTRIYTVPPSVLTVCNVSLCNTGATEARVCLALAAADSPANGEYIEYDALLPARASMERTGLVLEAGRRIVARADAAGVNIVVYGMED